MTNFSRDVGDLVRLLSGWARFAFWEAGTGGGGAPFDRTGFAIVTRGGGPVMLVKQHHETHEPSRDRICDWKEKDSGLNTGRQAQL